MRVIFCASSTGHAQTGRSNDWPACFTATPLTKTASPLSRGFLSSRKAGVTSHAGDWSAVKSRIGPNGSMGSNRHTKLPAFCGKNETQGVPRPEISECLGPPRWFTSRHSTASSACRKDSIRRLVFPPRTQSETRTRCTAEGWKGSFRRRRGWRRCARMPPSPRAISGGLAIVGSHNEKAGRMVRAL